MVSIGAFRRDSAVFLPSLLAGFAIFEVIFGDSLVSCKTGIEETFLKQVVGQGAVTPETALISDSSPLKGDQQSKEPSAV